MARIAIIGGSGHVGTYLVPRLVTIGHHVMNISRGTAKPYRPHAAWSRVEQVKVDRAAEDADGKFGARIAELKPDIVVDMIAFELDSVKQIVEALRGKIEHYIFCSSIWVYGNSSTVPTSEEEMPSGALEAYGQKKAEIEEWLLNQARVTGFPATSFRPGHIVGEGWVPINPQAHFNPDLYSTIARGEEIVLPNFGLEMLHHVHADDCALWVERAIHHRNATIGEAFNTVSSQAVTLKGYAEAMYRWFGQEPKLKFKPYDEWAQVVQKAEAECAWGHIARNSCMSIEKSRQRIGWVPRYSSLEAVQQSVGVLIEQGKVTENKS